MRGDWMDEAKRFEETDRAIMASLERENKYWQSVGGHPPAGHMDAPRVYECDAHGCGETGMLFDDGEMQQCADCDGHFCLAHMTSDADHQVAICLDCRDERADA